MRIIIIAFSLFVQSCCIAVNSISGEVNLFCTIETSGSQLTNIQLHFVNNTGCGIDITISEFNSEIGSKELSELRLFLHADGEETLTPIPLIKGINWDKTSESFIIANGDTLNYTIPLYLYETSNLNIEDFDRVRVHFNSINFVKCGESLVKEVILKSTCPIK